MVLASAGTNVVEQDPQNSCCQCLHPQGESQLPPAFLGDSLRSASGSDPGVFQITASILELGACEVLHMPFKSGVSVSYSPLAFLNTRLAYFQSQMF